MQRTRPGLAMLVVCSVLAAAAAASTSKERADVPEVAPVSAAGVRYQAPLFTRAQGLPRNGGYVEAVDVRSGQRKWLLDVVGPQADDGKEADKRDVFLTQLALSPDGKQLHATDERGHRYQIDLRSRSVTRLGRP